MMTFIELHAKLSQMGSTEATTVGQGLETIWWATKTDEEAHALALEYLKALQGWAKKAEEVLTGVRSDL